MSVVLMAGVPPIAPDQKPRYLALPKSRTAVSRQRSALGRQLVQGCAEESARADGLSRLRVWVGGSVMGESAMGAISSDCKD
jgi:hypothetical protein